MKPDYIQDTITKKLKNQYREQQNEIKPDMARQISYIINNGTLELINDKTKFSTLKLFGLRGKGFIYSNRESKQDIDIDKITMENHIDGDSYRWVLQPGDTNISKQNDYRNQTRTMISCRIKDKFIVVSEAPWKVYE